MRAARNIAAVGVVVAGVLAGACGCSKTSGRSVDVKAGDYYTEDEVATMSSSEQQAYCRALEAERNRLQGEVESTQQELVDARKQVESLRNQITPVEKEVLRTDAEIRTLTQQINQYEQLPREWKVNEGETLSQIAERDEIYADWTKWPRIYRANLDKIEDPLWIYPNMVLKIPRELPNEHVVAPFETLEMIAGYWEVYGDPAQWVRLYEANKDKVQDPTNPKPGTVLVIPR